VWGATVAYYGSSSVVSRAECEAIKRPWRQHLDRVSGRARGSPRCDLYGKNMRLHTYAVMASNLLHSVFRLLRDAHDTSARRIVRSELARTLFRLGCRSNPLSWGAGHLVEALRAQSAAPRGHRPLLDHVVLVWAEATNGACGLAEYRGAEGDPLLPAYPFWRGHTSTALFEPLQNGGIGAPFVYELAVAGVVAIDDIRGCQHSLEGFLDFESLRRRWPRVSDLKRIRADYGRTVDSARASSHQGVSLGSYVRRPYVSPDDIGTRQARLSSEGAAAAQSNLGGAGVVGAGGADPDALDGWTEQVLGELRGGAAARSLTTVLSSTLRQALGGAEPVGLIRYPHGGDSRLQLQRTASVFAWMPGGRF